MNQLRVLALYPDRMNIYADRGNLIFLQRRCEWREIDFRLKSSGVGDAVEPEDADLIYIGGGQDRDQREIAEDLTSVKREGIVAAVDSGSALLAVCGGFQLLGHSYEMEGVTLEGLGLCDLTTRRETGERLIGNVEIRVEGLPGVDSAMTLAGFENHGGRTYLGPGAAPLGRVLTGNGNNGADGTEGVREGKVIGTYLHGPLLPKNHWFADWLIRESLSRGDRLPPELRELDDSLERAAHESARSACRS